MESGSIVKMKISQIVVYRAHVRDYQRKTLAKLIESIERVGLIEPLLCVKFQGTYVLVDGFLRYCALQNLKKKTCHIKVLL